MTEFCSIDRVTYPLPCQQSYMRWSAHSLPPLDTVSQGRRESGLQQMHPEALQGSSSKVPFNKEVTAICPA